MTQDEFLATYYPEYAGIGGVTTTKTNTAGTGFSHTLRTPETHPWLFINPGEVDVDGKIRDGSVINTGTRYIGSRTATPEEIRASTASNNYFQNGGQGLDPRLMEGMTRNDFMSKDFTNQYGTYTRNYAWNDPARERLGLDPWTEVASSFRGVDQQGNPVNYQNQDSIWGNRGPGYGGSTGPYAGTGEPRRIPLPGAMTAAALRSPGGTAGGAPGGTTNYVGLPTGHSQFGGSGPKQPASAPAWWQQMMMNMPGQQAGPTGSGGAT